MEISSLPIELEAKNGDASLITEAMKVEEETLQEEREKEEEEAAKSRKLDPNFKFSKLDELLTQTQLYSEFLLERMEDITTVTICQELLFCIITKVKQRKKKFCLSLLKSDVFAVKRGTTTVSAVNFHFTSFTLFE